MQNFTQLKKKILQLTCLTCILASFSISRAEILIFISHSMPDEALKAYFEDAQALGARLIVRGLYRDSFEETRIKVQSLEIDYDIDPNLFDQYQVLHVPTIVEDDGQNVKKCSGHITLKSALELFAKK